MKIQITETVLRDAQQSLMATRMPTADFLPILEKMDQADITRWSAGAALPLTAACAIWTRIPGSGCAPSAAM